MSGPYQWLGPCFAQFVTRTVTNVASRVPLVLEPLDPSSCHSGRGEIVRVTTPSRRWHASGPRSPGTVRAGRGSCWVMEHIGDLAATSEPVERGAATAGFSVLYRERYTDMVRLAAAIVGSREQAEEVVQDAFAATYGRLASVLDPEAYVRTCVINGCRKALRRRSVRRRSAIEPSPTEAVDVHDHLFDVIAELPPRQRMVVVLRYHEGLTDAEIGAALGVPIGSVKSALSRAKQRLREELAP